MSGMAHLPEPGDASLQGEVVSIAERVVIAPSWGRIRRAMAEDEQVAAGAPVGTLVERGAETVLVAPCAGVLVGWLVMEGERVPPGRPLARIRVLAAAEPAPQVPSAAEPSPTVPLLLSRALTASVQSDRHLDRAREELRLALTILDRMDPPAGHLVGSLQKRLESLEALAQDRGTPDD